MIRWAEKAWARREAEGDRGRERERERSTRRRAEGSWPSINDILAGYLIYRDAVLVIPHLCFQGWSAGLKARKTGNSPNLRQTLVFSFILTMGLERFCVKTPGRAELVARSLLCMIGLLFTLSQPVCEAFNLDVDNPSVYSGPNGSYFGYAVDFYLADSSRWVSLTHKTSNVHFQRYYGKILRNKLQNKVWKSCLSFSMGTTPSCTQICCAPRKLSTGSDMKFFSQTSEQLFTTPLVKLQGQFPTGKTLFVSGMLLALTLNQGFGYSAFWRHALRTAHTPSACTLTHIEYIFIK